MADVTGPISTLPGTCREPPPETPCDDHPDRPASTRVQGETDSFGCEMIDMCEECFAQYRIALNSPEWLDARNGDCEWCCKPATDLRDARDYEEGMYGRVYRICGACKKHRDDEDRLYLADYDDEFDRE